MRVTQRLGATVACDWRQPRSRGGVIGAYEHEMEAGTPVSAVDAYFVACQIDAAIGPHPVHRQAGSPSELTLGRNVG